MLTRDQILASKDLADTKKVSVPEWGGDLLVKVMTGAERDQWEVKATNLARAQGGANIRALLCAITICDEAGNRLFDDSEVEKLGDKSSIALSRVFDAARKLNRLTDDDIEELEKN